MADINITNDKKIYWPTTLFMIFVPSITFIAVPWYIVQNGFPTAILIFALIYAFLTNLSITAGYHRLMSHRSYEAHVIPKFLFLLIGASAWQGSALKWSSDHRKHHQKVDSEEDPYSITKGFWHAHMGWLFYHDSVNLPVSAPDLEKDKLIMLQHNYYYTIAIFMSFIFPGIVGYFMGSFWAGVLIAGCLRVVLTQQSTFLVNSLTHTLGKQTYSDKVSARDSLFVAFLTHGEGYHNFHHTFQFDYRNGIRWYQWDPTKWTIRFLWLCGLARKLKKIPDTEILKARLKMEKMKLQAHGYSQEKIEHLHERILAAQEQIKKLKAEYQTLKKEFSDKSHQKLEEIKRDLEIARIEFQLSRKQWEVCLADY